MGVEERGASASEPGIEPGTEAGGPQQNWRKSV